jgi:hypothetical protein
MGNVTQSANWLNLGGKYIHNSHIGKYMHNLFIFRSGMTVLACVFYHSLCLVDILANLDQYMYEVYYAAVNSHL